MKNSSVDLAALPAGKQLAVRRVALDLTQSAIAERLGVPPVRVSEAERESRYRSPQNLKALQEQIDAVLRDYEERGARHASAA